MISKKKLLVEKCKPKPETKVENFCISLEHFDNTQGQGFKDWQRSGLLSLTMELLTGYCKKPLMEQVDKKKFAIYKSPPPKDKTKFIIPDYIPEDANWARIHINNRSVLVGHIVGNKFYIVFLDKRHGFWLSEKKHT